jgi:hypothetical protein
MLKRDGMQYKGSTYQKRTSDQNEDTIVSRRLSVDGVGAMLDLLEWQVLLRISPSPCCVSGSHCYLELLYDGG